MMSAEPLTDLFNVLHIEGKANQASMTRQILCRPVLDPSAAILCFNMDKLEMCRPIQIFDTLKPFIPFPHSGL